MKKGVLVAAICFAATFLSGICALADTTEDFFAQAVAAERLGNLDDSIF